MTLYHKTNHGALFCADSTEFLKKIPSNSIDSCITDPPYAINFFQMKWDVEVPSVELWREVFRVLKPGAVALVFSGSRTQHKMATNIEEAGFDIKDCIQYFSNPDILSFYNSLDKEQKQAYINLQGGNTLFWCYSTGMPKTNSIDLLVDKHFKVDRTVIGTKTKGSSPLSGNHNKEWTDGQRDGTFNVTEATHDEAKKWTGYSTVGLKPSYEPILIAMKPNNGTYAENALKHKVSGINTKDTKIETGNRYPANTLISHDPKCTATDCTDDCQIKHLDGQFKSSPSKCFKNIPVDIQNNIIYVPKPSIKEKKEPFEDKFVISNDTLKQKIGNKIISKKQYDLLPQSTKELFIPFVNKHPTQKPLALMEYLCLLTKTPSGGVVLEPFAGSGTTLVACIKTGRKYLGIEREKDYCEISKTRLEHEANKVETIDNTQN